MFYAAIADLYIFSYIMLFIWIIRSLKFLPKKMHTIKMDAYTQTTNCNVQKEVATQTIKVLLKDVDTHTDDMGKTDSQLTDDNEVLLSIIEKSKCSDSKIYSRVKLARAISDNKCDK